MVSRANFDEVASREHVRWLEDRGAWLLAYVPYTPVDRHADGALEMDAAMREALFDRSIALNREVRRLAILDLLGIEQHLTSCPAAVWSMCVYHDGTLTPCPAVAMGRADSNVRRRPLRDAFLNDPLYRELRALHAAAAPGTPVHCLFYTDPAFFKAYLEEHRDEVRVLNPGVAARIEQAGSGGSS
jgi:MoaA/NifB/PqqE/SkfB family radical SAM enzyme